MQRIYNGDMYDKSFTCLLLPGDGIGPEVISQAKLVLEKCNATYKLGITFTQGVIGGAAIDTTNSPLPAATIELAEQADAILMGAIGGPKWDGLPLEQSPEKGLLQLRSHFGFFANYRPATLYSALADASPIKTELVKGADLLILRELTGGLYFGEPRGFNEDASAAYNTMRYSKDEIIRLGRLAFVAAANRRGKLCSVDKANVLEVSRLWRSTITELADEYPNVELSHLYVDNAAMQLVREPTSFDVIVTENLFGDVLSDISAQLVGSIGMLPSASIREDSKGLYEPVHGSAPDIAGKNQSNPFATILSAAMMLRYSFQQEEAATAIDNAVTKAIEAGIRTADITKEGDVISSCSQAGSAVLSYL